MPEKLLFKAGDVSGEENIFIKKNILNRKIENMTGLELQPCLLFIGILQSKPLILQNNFVRLQKE